MDQNKIESLKSCNYERENFSLKTTLSPLNLDRELEKESNLEDSIEFFQTFAGRQALVKILCLYLASLRESQNLTYTAMSYVPTDDMKGELSTEGGSLTEEIKAIMNAIRSVVGHDFDIYKSGAFDPNKSDDFIWNNIKLFYVNNIPGEIEKRHEHTRGHKPKHEREENRTFLGDLSKNAKEFYDSLRGYDDNTKKYSKMDLNYMDYLKSLSKPETSLADAIDTINNADSKDLQQLAMATPSVDESAPADPAMDTSDATVDKLFSRRILQNGAVKMNNRVIKRAFSNEQACDMLANKLSQDWFVCEPQSEPVIAEQLKLAQIPCHVFAPALKCNRFQYDGEAPVSKLELAALDKIQCFIEDLRKEILAGHIDNIELVPETKAFAMKQELRRIAKNFAEEEGISFEEAVGTPAALVEAADDGVDYYDDEAYEIVAKAAENGELPAEPALTAPVAKPAEEMGASYDAVVDSTIADNPVGIEQKDMTEYDPKAGELSLSAAPAGDAMAVMNSDAICTGLEPAVEEKAEEVIAPVQPIMADEAAAQNFSRSLHRKQAASQNFSAKKPVVTTKGLSRLLGDKYIK